MTTTAFTNGVTLTDAGWFNDTDTVTYASLTTVAGTNTITATGPSSFTAYAAGQRWLVKPAATNTAATTINISGKGARSIFAGGMPCVGGELAIGLPVVLIDDGTQLHVAGNAAGTSVPRSYLAGLALSTAGASTTMSTAAGMAADSGNAVAMKLGSALAKTTSAWAVGTGNGGLDTGAIGAATWYHFFLIMRADTGVVDVLFSTNASAPTMPANYTYKRRIGSGLTNGSSQWVAFLQDGDLFQLSVPVLETTSANPGTNAVTQTLANVPTGVNVNAFLNVKANGMSAYISDLATTDAAPSTSAAPLSTVIKPGANDNGSQARVRTNTSAQIRTRISASGAGEQLLIATLGWWDRRGQDS